MAQRMVQHVHHSRPFVVALGRCAVDPPGILNEHIWARVRVRPSVSVSLPTPKDLEPCSLAIPWRKTPHSSRVCEQACDSHHTQFCRRNQNPGDTHWFLKGSFFRGRAHFQGPGPLCLIQQPAWPRGRVSTENYRNITVELLNSLNSPPS